MATNLPHEVEEKCQPVHRNLEMKINEIDALVIMVEGWGAWKKLKNNEKKESALQCQTQ